jgi:hypothetical protein
MAVLTEVQNTPAGTTFKPGDNADIDAAVADGTLAGVTVGADGNYVMEDGNPITSAGGTTTVVDLSQATDEDLSAIKELAEASFLAGSTGVSSGVLSAAQRKLGLDPNDTNTHTLAQKILKEAGYETGGGATYFDGVGGYDGDDAGIKILLERYKDTPTDQDLIDAGLDPEEYSVVRNNAAEAFYVEEKLKEMGLGAANTNAILGSTAGYLGGDKSSLGMQGALNVQDVRDEMDKMRLQYGADNPNWKTQDKQLDIYEWDLLKKKTDVKEKPGGTDGRPTGTINVGGAGSVGTGNIIGGGTGDGTYTGPNFVSTPNIGVTTPVYGADQTGLTEVDIPTYEAGLGLQQTQFENRAAESAKLRQPQTLAEQQAAGTSPAFENVMYRNRFGMTMYIQHINGVPSQPIPPGYFRVKGFETEAQTQGGSAAAAQGQNQGGVIQGFNPGGTVNPALNYKPGGTVVEQNGVFRIKYPDGTYSQNYDTALNAKAANDMGLANLGLPDYGTYLSDQGVNMNLPGYDETAYQSAYQTYITDPATLQTIQAQQEQEEVVDTTPQTGNVNLDFPTGEMAVDREALAQYQANLNAQAYAAPGGAVAASPVSYIDPNTYGTVMDSSTGQALDTAPMVQEDQVAQISSATTADTPTGQGAATYDANQAFSDVQKATTGMTPATMTGGPTQTIDAATATSSSVSGLTGATGESVDVTGAPTRTLQTGPQGELIQGTGVDQERVGQAFGTGEVQAASIQGELANLMSQFEGGDTPAWAAGSMRAASQMLAARGLGASSMAGQAVIQAAMEAALPIAQIDTANKQQVALFKAEQRAKFLQMDFDQAFQAKVQNAARVSEIANLNFTAEQQIALENSKAANTMELQNLSNEQALVMAEAAALSQLDTQNLSNRQQAAVQNAQNFLQIDMANLANEQQTALFKQQSLVNSILSDQAAANAAAQFNATSENQTNQFFSNLAASVNQFNAAQMNAMKQFNADEVNSLLEFNASMQNQREMFNAQNYLVVAQANAQWRQNLATINTAAANESNMAYTQAVNGLTMTSLDEIWQRERDILSMAFQISENNANRANEIVLQKLAADASTDAAKLQAEIEASAGAGDFVKEVFLKIIGI